MANCPLVSIICPLYNKKNYVQETIDSVINQTYTNWEMIIVDDGSTDGSYELVEEIYKSNDGIKLYHRSDFKQNKGGSVCRNVGIELAKGEFILFLDADDLLIKECLANRIDLQAHFPGQDMYIFPETYFKENIDNVVKRRGWNWLDRLLYKCSTEKKAYFLRRFLKYYLPFQTTCVLWSVQTLKMIDGFDETFQRLQDPEIHTKALLQETVKIKDFLFSQPADAYIRLDEQRHIHSMGTLKEKYLAHIESSEKFVSKFKAALQENKKSLVKYLSVHLMMAETSINNVLISSESCDATFYLSLREDVSKFRKAQNLCLSRLAQRVISLHGYLVRHNILRRIKLPALLNLILIYFGKFIK